MLSEGKVSVNKELEIYANLSMYQLLHSLPRILSRRGCMLDISDILLSCLVTLFSCFMLLSSVPILTISYTDTDHMGHISQPVSQG